MKPVPAWWIVPAAALGWIIGLVVVRHTDAATQIMTIRAFTLIGCVGVVLSALELFRNHKRRNS